MKLLVIGAGYSGSRIASNAVKVADVVGTCRSSERCAELEHKGISAVLLHSSLSDSLVAHLRSATHLITTVAPDRGQPFHEPILNLLDDVVNGGLPSLQWIGYLSTIGVYGDHGGDWVNEATPCTTVQARSQMRLQAESAWQSTARSLNVPLAILRLSGIYGPGRNALCSAAAGKSRMLIKPGQVFNRVHVDDLAQAAVSAMLKRVDGVINVTDDMPAPPQNVVRFAHELMQTESPVAVDFDTAELSAMAKSFFSENKRVCNARSCEWLDMQYRYPDYESGLQALWDSGDWQHDKI